MLKNVFCFVLGICLFNYSYAWQVAYKKSAEAIAFEKQNPQLTKYLKKNFVSIPLMTYKIGYFEGSDSVNLSPYSQHLAVAPFFLSKHETSVAEYMEFCKANDGMYNGISLYPQIDNLQNFPYRSLKSYLEEKKYQNYPIIGVNKDQSMAYCEWFSDNIRKQYNLKKDKGAISFILPTTAFFEIAALVSQPKKDEFSNSENFPGAYYSLYANYNKADKLNSKLSDVKSHKSSSHKFYNLLGNVAEWCLDGARDKYLIIKENDKYVQTNELLYRIPDNLKSNSKNPGLVLGGAYNLDSFYLQPAVKIPLDPDKGYGWVGFRVAGFLSGSELVPNKKSTYKFL